MERQAKETLMSTGIKVAQFFILGAMLTTAFSVSAQQARPEQRRPTPPSPKSTAPPPPQNPAPPPAQGAGPQSTTATYDDWVVQCQGGTAAVPAKRCGMVQGTQTQGNNLPFSRVMILRTDKGEPVKLVVQVPVNVTFSENLRIQYGGPDQALSTPFARCVPAGCFGEFVLTEETIGKLRAASGAGKISYLSASGGDINVPISFKGFARAFDVLAKE